MSWEEMVVDIFSSCMVGGCWRCVPFLRGCRLVVCELCGWACCHLLMLSALSLSVSAVLRPSPSCCILFFCLTDQLTGSSDSTTGDGAAPCWSVCVTAAGSPGHVSGDADAAVVPVDVSCAPSDGSLSYRVRVGVEEVFSCQC
ncbi:hypothetical protein TcCL_ESM08919 [Trypanosoma cruzi]|nr:hypothetical protein TcCL_ESM08919 [Trypanosoma cruzi]